MFGFGVVVVNMKSWDLHIFKKIMHCGSTCFGQMQPNKIIVVDHDKKKAFQEEGLLRSDNDYQTMFAAAVRVDAFVPVRTT